MIIKKIVVGKYQANCYLVTDKETLGAVIIDPGGEPEKISAEIKKENLKPKFILLTHNHPDHIGASKPIADLFDADCPTLKDGEKINSGNLTIKVIATPGHTSESVCYIIGDSVKDGASIIFSGDTLFKGSIGRTSLRGGDYNQIQKSLKRLMEFSDNFKVYPGHGEETTIGEERKNNPFLQN